MKWTLNDLIVATGGELSAQSADKEAVGFDFVSTDSREMSESGLYIAVKGANFDGHAFVSQAVAQGASVVLASEPVEAPVPVVLVDDTRIALGQFAAWHRKQMPLKKLIAVTGSNGKTTCKNMIQHLLSKQAKVLATQGNLNNDFGVPRTLLQLTAEHEFAVVEMGANHHKEIEYLTQLAKPDIAIITLAAGAHLEGFGSLEGVIHTKAEILSGLQDKVGVAVLNTDSPGFDVWQDMCRERELSVLTFGATAIADVHYEQFEQSSDVIEFDVISTADKMIHQGKFHVVAPMLGEHNAMNACAALTAAMACGFKLETLTPNLADFGGVSGRLQKVSLPNGILIDDSYNANPDSMKAALRTLVALPGKSMACLGAMAEIGETSASAHAEVASYAKSLGVSYLLIYGEAAKPMIDAFGEGAFWFESHQALTDKAIELIEKDGINHCLVKGSRSSKMETVAQGISEHFINHLKPQNT
jgi:UDP-N-acetylmuramoyl-tripeptide--D-alanyl-D-alanine ligase